MTASDPLVDVPIRDLGSHGDRLVHTRTFASAAEKVSYLVDLARAGALRRDRFGVRGLAVELGSIARIHTWVRDLIAYDDEQIESLETPAYTATWLRGDCDAQSTLLACLVLVLGGSALLVPLGGEPDDPSHLACQVREGGGRILAAPWEPHGRPARPGFRWAETIIAADYGEIPIAAAVRLGADPGRF